MKRSEYKKLLLEFLQLNESSGKKKSLLNETKYQVDLEMDDEMLYKDDTGNWETYVVDQPMTYFVETGDIYKDVFVDANEDLQYTTSGGKRAIRSSDYTEVSPTPAQQVPPVPEKKSLSSSAETSIKEIQKIIKAPSSNNGTKLGDGNWGKKTQAAFVKYLNTNSEALKEKGIDDPSKFASDATYMKQKLDNLGHPKNVKGVLALLQSLETKEDGETTSATSKDDNVYVVEDNFRNKYYKDENNDFYYVDADGRYVYKDTLKYEAFGTDPFASFNSEDKIRVPGQVEGTTVEVSKWGNTVDKIHYKEWTEITEEEAEVLANKEEAAAPAAAPSPDNAKSKTRRETRRETRKDRKRARLQNRLNRLQETNMNEKLINEMKKGKASLLNLLNEKVPEKMGKPEGSGGPEVKIDSWEKYIKKGSEHKKLADLWKQHANKEEFNGKTKFTNSDNIMNFPGNYETSLSGFAKWYKHAQKSEQAMSTIDKNPGQQFSPKEAQTMLVKLVGMLDSGEEKGSTQQADSKRHPVSSIVRLLKKKISGLGLDTDVVAAYFDSLDEEKDEEEIRGLFSKIKSGATAEDVKAHINKLAGQEMFESLSRGSLYRRRYHGRY